MNTFPNTPIESVSRISPAYQKRLLKLGIKTLKDLFYHFPFRYDDFSKIKPISQLKINEVATIQGEIIEIKNIRTWKRKIYITEAYIKDSSGIIKAVWFNQPFLLNNLKQGQNISVSGKVNFDKSLYFSNPAYEKIARTKDRSNLKHTGGLISVYPETERLSSRWLRYIIKMLLPKALPAIKDYLPLEIKKNEQLIDLEKAIWQIHFPQSQKHIEAARQRLAFDELFLIQLYTLEQRSRWQKQSAPKIAFNQPLIKKFVDSLPFKLTGAQKKAAWEIIQDMAKAKPMNRLLEGDVGSGKTVVAAMAVIEAVNAGWQAALMAPTEILAQQHFKEIIKLFEGFGIKTGLLTGAENKIFTGSDVADVPKKELLTKTKNGEVQFLIGTHALIQKTVLFKNLALVIVDEQHRFGVAQRAALQKPPAEKVIAQINDGSASTIPHLLSMTATPIPRTLALTIYGDLDISLLDEMPKGRQEIITKIITPANRQKAYEFIKLQIKDGRQVFVVCPRIESKAPSNQNDELPLKNIRSWDDVKAVKEEYEKLKKSIFPKFKIAMLHGKLKSKEKEKIMTDFKKGDVDILVSTSVIEVGIDVPNASVMMIEGSERFGLAQLHQFRGRVGRGPHQSYCFLFTESASKNTSARLKALVGSKNGFELAEKDLQIRGPGDFFGTRQWGIPDLTMASLSDLELIKKSRNAAASIIKKDPDLKSYPLLRARLNLAQEAIHLE